MASEDVHGEAEGPGGFDPVAKWRGNSRLRGGPRVSIQAGESIRLLGEAYEAIGRPDGVRCFIDGMKVAFVPDDPDHPHSYSPDATPNGGASFSGGWLKHELESGETPDRGQYEADLEDGMVIVDFGSDPHAE